MSIRWWKILFLRGGNFEIKAKFYAQKLDCIVPIVSPQETLRTNSDIISASKLYTVRVYTPLF